MKKIYYFLVKAPTIIDLPGLSASFKSGDLLELSEELAQMVLKREISFTGMEHVELSAIASIDLDTAIAEVDDTQSSTSLVPNGSEKLNDIEEGETNTGSKQETSLADDAHCSTVKAYLNQILATEPINSDLLIEVKERFGSRCKAVGSEIETILNSRV